MFKTQEQFLADRAGLLREFNDCQKDTDAARRHEARLVQVGQAIRVAVAGNGALFAADAEVEAMAAAAVSVYERARGR
jgi:hypothetical protein